MNEEGSMEKNQGHYGLFTAITMIVGVVVGSGIFFKSDDVLIYTGGNVALGVLVFCIGAFSIIFGSLTLTEIANRTQKSGGFVAYYEEFISKEAACGFGWFQTFIYLPTINAVVSWVAGSYICTFLGIKATLELEILLGLAVIIVIYAMNILSLRLGGYFQNLSTIVKLIPLLAIAAIGIFWDTAYPAVPADTQLITSRNVGFGWIAALAPIAFSYDGWVVVTSITKEIRNSKRNIPLALVIGPLVVLSVYVFYFLGLNKILGPEYIMSLGNSAINKVGELLLGANGTKIILIFITIAVVGVVNGLTLGSIRMPQALASKDMIPFSNKVEKINPKFQLSLWSCIISLITSLVWSFVHYLTQKIQLLGRIDVSEIAIVFSYLSYILLYIKVIKMKKEGIITSFFTGLICPVLGILGSAIIVVGGIFSNPLYGTIIVAFCLFIFIAGAIYYKNKNKKTSVNSQ